MRDKGSRADRAALAAFGLVSDRLDVARASELMTLAQRPEYSG